jgi:hypothetical protein
MPSRLHWIETEVLSQDDNREGLSRIRKLLMKAEAMDSQPAGGLGHGQHGNLVHGEPEPSTHNRQFDSACYHPQLLLNRAGECSAARLRPGNVHSAEVEQRAFARN